VGEVFYFVVVLGAVARRDFVIHRVQSSQRHSTFLRCTLRGTFPPTLIPIKPMTRKATRQGVQLTRTDRHSDYSSRRVTVLLIPFKVVLVQGGRMVLIKLFAPFLVHRKVLAFPLLPRVNDLLVAAHAVAGRL
jgi:hypothetical protein